MKVETQNLPQNAVVGNYELKSIRVTYLIYVCISMQKIKKDKQHEEVEIKF